MTFRPTSLTANRQRRELSILWEDGHQSLYPFELLRAGCPCTECRGGHDKMGSTPPVEVFEARIEDELKLTLQNIVPVGTYAVAPIWGDGHDAGIYQWDYLRALCPCKNCRP